MPELRKGSERPRELWIPLRDKTSSAIHKADYDRISWSPNFIPEGTHLAIDVVGINNLLASSRLAFPIEIVSYNQPDVQDFDFSYRPNFMGKAASAALESIKTRSRKPQKTGEFLYDEEGNQGYMRINFKSILDRLEEVLPGGRNNPDFYKQYGQAVDRTIKSQLGKAINVNFVLLYQEHPEVFVEENTRVVWGLVPAGYGGIFALLELILNRNPLNAAVDIRDALMAFEAVWLVTGVTSSIRNTEYGKYVIDKLVHGNISEKLEQLYPQNFLAYFVLPYVVNASWQKDLIRGKNN